MSVVIFHEYAGILLKTKSAQQAASTDEKHVQYIFCTLGTPRALGYSDWGELPFAESLGSHIKVS